MAARELRASARQAFTYHLRVAGAGALLVASFVFGVSHGFAPTLGNELFAKLHFTLFCAIWVFVPFLTADCISRERREGTLGLLFLTPLRAADIVMAKGLAQGLRALTLWLAVLPVVTISFLVGGISWAEVTLSVLINFSAICLALAAGLLASSLSRVWSRVLVYAGSFSLAMCVMCSLVHILFAWVCMRNALLPTPFEDLLSESFQFVTNWDSDWSSGLGSLTTADKRRLFFGSGAASLFCLFGLALAIRFAARRVNRVWREEPLSARVVWLEKKFCTPVFFRSFFRRWMLNKLDRNPIGWLEVRSWTGRIVTWTWLGLIVCVYSFALSGPWIARGTSGLHQVLAWLMGGSLAISAAASFRRERETGVLELLLVSPLSETEIISGRLRGLWAQFLPAVALLIAIWSYLGSLFGFGSIFNESDDPGVILYYASAFVSMPIIGLYFSLSRRSFIAAFLSTLVVGLLLPPVLAGAVALVMYFAGAASPGGPMFGGSGLPSAEGSAFCQLALAAFCWVRLLSRLRRRAFPLEKVAV